jgi:tRNA(Ile)-lysidine synthase TilS/MesJ
MFDEHISEKAKHFKIVLTVAHLDHNLSNNDYSNLKALCQKCHLNYDKEHHSKNRRKTIKSKKKLVELPFPQTER